MRGNLAVASHAREIGREADDFTMAKMSCELTSKAARCSIISYALQLELNAETSLVAMSRKSIVVGCN